MQRYVAGFPIVVVAGAAVVACGGGGASRTDAAADTGAGGAAGGGVDAGADAPGGGVDAVGPGLDVPPDLSPAQVAAALDGLRWELPCSNNDAYYCDTPEAKTVETTLTGPPGTRYDITLRFRGVVEQKTYEGGTADGMWSAGGEPAFDLYNIYKLEISDPPAVYFLNAGQSNLGYCVPLDYTKTIRVAAGATVSMTADPVDTAQVNNHAEAGAPIVVAGIPPAPDPYDGQFIQMDVVSVAVAP